MKKKLLLAVSVLMMGVTQAQVETGLLLKYSFNDQTANDQSGNGNNGTTINVTGAQDRFGNPNKAFAFNGSGSQINLPNSLLTIPEVSISLWFKTSGSRGCIIGKQNVAPNTTPNHYVPMVYLRSDNELNAKLWDGNTGNVNGSTTNYSDNNWHHLVLTGNAADQKVYIDGVLTGTGSAYLPQGNTPYIQLGTGYVHGTWPSVSGAYGWADFTGSIDDVRVYNRSINSTDVNSLFNLPFEEQRDTLYVNQLATGNNDGSSWANAYTDAREAFINTTDGDEVWIAKGTYIRNSTDRNTVFGWTVDSVEVYGGFSGDGTETSISQRDWDANPTIFSGDIGTVGDDSDNAYTVFVGPIGNQTYSLIDGVKITGGNANVGSYGAFSYNGGGLAIEAKVDLIELNNIEIYDNYANAGGALDLYSYTAEPTKLKMNNIIAHNNSGTSAPFAHVRSTAGGKITLEMTNCLIYENEATGTNSSGADFGTVMLLGSNTGTSNGINATITNCTFANNQYPTGHYSKGMIRTYGPGTSVTSLRFTNNICYGNGIAELSNKNYANTVDAFGSVDLKNNILENPVDFTATSETNTLISDPLFNADYTLALGSPAIDAGTTSSVNLPSLDLAGKNRVFGPEVDLGAYEYGAAAGPTTITEIDTYSITAYPNPTNGLVSFNTTEPIQNIEVFNLSGQKVLEFNNVNTINISSLPSGIYTAKIIVGTSNPTIERLIKH